MIQERSILKVADNSGARLIRCFRVLGGTRRRYARIGDVIVASVQTAEPKHAAKPVKKKEIVRAVVVRSRNPLRRADGSYVRFDENAVVVVNNKKEPVGTRMFGPMPRELKENGFDKILTMAEDIV